MKTPVGQTPAFETKWQALMRQLETVLSIAHRREPNATETAEAISIAQYHLKGIADTLNAAAQAPKKPDTCDGCLRVGVTNCLTCINAPA